MVSSTCPHYEAEGRSHLYPHREPLETGSASLSQCPICRDRKVCLSCIAFSGADEFDGLEFTRRRVRLGQAVYRAGDAFKAFYAVHSGSFKSSVIIDDGREQITGFHMVGEIIGLDGFGSRRHLSSAVALEDSELCIINCRQFERNDEMAPRRQQCLQQLMNAEIQRQRSVILLLGTMRAEVRLATFLVTLSQCFGARGYSPLEFRLRMTREEIGNFLGMRLETISRLLSKFQEEGILEIEHRLIKLTNPTALRNLARLIN